MRRHEDQITVSSKQIRDFLFSHTKPEFKILHALSLLFFKKHKTVGLIPRLLFTYKQD
jgi:hypothetical protein